MVNIPKGTKDVLPGDAYKWQFIESTARSLAELFGAKEVRTPVFEHTELFARAVGDVTDIVTKEMYTFEDKGGRSLTLKPEGTAGVVRSFIENSLDVSLPLKTFYITPVYRYERPQAGRYREHHQFGAEFFGSSNYDFDFEVLAFAHAFLHKTGVKGVTLYVNSIGCDKCRGEYNAALRGFLTAHSESLCGDCRIRAEKNPLRALDCKNIECRKILDKAPKISDYLCEDCKSHFASLLALLDSHGIAYKVDAELVRGLDYYTKTVFEFKAENELTVLGGGRYDNLVSELGGKPTACVGFGCGIERLISYLDTENAIPPEKQPLFYAAAQFDGARDFCRDMAFELRENGVSCDYDLMGRSLKAQLKFADKRAFKYVAVVGESELKSKTLILKKMSDGSQTELRREDVLNFLLRENG